MEENPDGEEDLTPFWVQSTAENRRASRLRRRVSSVFLSSGLVVFLLLVTALFFLAFIVPSTISFSAQILKPNSVKKSWDSINIVLVLVAVVFGFLSRNNKNEDRYTYYEDGQQQAKEKSNPSTPNQWRSYSAIEQEKSSFSAPNQWQSYSTMEQEKSSFSALNQWQSYSTMDQEKSSFSAPNQWYDYSDYQTKLAYKNQTMKRNSSSYPDLRESSSIGGDFERRFYDDSNVDPVRVADPVHFQTHRRYRSLETINLQNKPYIVDTLVNNSAETLDLPNLTTPPTIPPEQAPPAAAIPPEQPPEAEFQEKPKRTNENEVRRKERLRRKMEKNLESTAPVIDPPAAEPQPLEPEPITSKIERKRSGATVNATKDFLNSLYSKKKKKQRQRSVDNLDSLLHRSEAPLNFHIPPPTSPPPNSPSVFQNLFSSKKHKRKRTIRVTVKSPPPAQNVVLEPKPNPQPRNKIPPKPVKKNKFEKLEEISTSGGESPMNRIPPPPPPPPPFIKKPAWNFVVQGDYVRINSNSSSRSESPDLDDVDGGDLTPIAPDSVDLTPVRSSASQSFCPSPDVNLKAEDFISSFRAKLKLEKIYSMKNRELGLSSLGPGPGPNPGPSQI